LQTRLLLYYFKVYIIDAIQKLDVEMVILYLSVEKKG